MSDKGEHEHDYTQEEHQLDEIQVPPTRMGSHAGDMCEPRSATNHQPSNPTIHSKLNLLSTKHSWKS